MSLCCKEDDRRDAVRALAGWNGLNYLEVSQDQRTLSVYFLGKLPPEFGPGKSGLERYFSVEGGQRVTGIQVTAVKPQPDPDPDKDDYLEVRLNLGPNKYPDFSTYTLKLVGVKDVDAHYDHLDFSFKVDCPSPLDCAPVCSCAPPVLTEPDINYLAKDYESFRQLLLDRLALLLPGWTERHVPDLMIALVEVLAYTGDYLSYYQDAVATEAYLDTARERISVRRLARLVDYVLHEGCNARAWVCVGVSQDQAFDPAEIVFITGLNNALSVNPAILMWSDLASVPTQSYEVFEPLVADPTLPLQLYAAHNEIHFYTWGQTQCCLERGSTSAALLDAWVTPAGSPAAAPPVAAPAAAGPPAPTPPAGASPAVGAPSVAAVPPAVGNLPRRLQLQAGDVLIFEEVLGSRTGLAADADPTHRWAVRLTKITQGQDPVVTSAGQPTPYVIVEWGPEDALPFPFCLSAIGLAPGCEYIENISVARGNVILVDHGKSVGPEALGTVPTLQSQAACECAGRPGDIQLLPGRFRPQLAQSPLTYREPLPVDNPAKGSWTPAASLLGQDVNSALPQVWLDSTPAAAWAASYDLIASGPAAPNFVVEIDNHGVAHLRFGDGDLGLQPPAGMVFNASYRVGNGLAGNVGPESISRLLLKNERLHGLSVTVRNPLPAQGGTEPVALTAAKLVAPGAFRTVIERAVIAADYEQLAERNTKVQRASAELRWTGSWYEADVAIDPLGSEDPSAALLAEIAGYLYPFRRLGHDLRVLPARYVPLDVQMKVLVLPNYLQAHVYAALLDAFSNRVLPGGQLGFFHPDNLTFGEGVFVSKIVAAALAVTGVGCARVTRFQRLFEAPNGELESGVLPMSVDEIAQLDNDPNYPEHGQLQIQVSGGL